MTDTTGETAANGAALAAIRELGERGQAIEIGRISIRSDGGVEIKNLEFPIPFTFNWRGTKFDGRLDQREGRVYLHLAAGLCTVPFTGENAPARRSVLDTLLSGEGAEDCLIELTPHNELLLRNTVELLQPNSCTVKKVVSNIVKLTLRAKPHLDSFGQLPPARHGANA